VIAERGKRRVIDSLWKGVKGCAKQRAARPNASLSEGARCGWRRRGGKIEGATAFRPLRPLLIAPQSFEASRLNLALKINPLPQLGKRFLYQELWKGVQGCAKREARTSSFARKMLPQRGPIPGETHLRAARQKDLAGTGRRNSKKIEGPTASRPLDPLSIAPQSF